MEADWTLAGGWTQPRILSSFGTDVFRPPALAVDAGGDAVVAWVADDKVYASFRRAGRAWQAPRALSPGSVTGDDPRVGIDDRGRALVIWTAARGSSGAYHFALKVVARQRTGVWGTPKIVCHCGSIAALAMNGRGLALVVWSPGRGLWAETRSPRGRWSARQEVSSEGTGLAYLPLAMNSRGGAVVAWLADAPHPPYEQLAVAIRPALGHFERPQIVGGDAYWDSWSGLRRRERQP